MRRPVSRDRIPRGASRASAPGRRRRRSRLSPRAALLALPALGALVVSPALAIEAAGRATRVVVFPDRAEVTRLVEVDVPAGASEVLVSGLPLGIEPDSVQVAGRGVPAEIGAVELGAEAQEPARTPELEAAERDVRRIEEDIAALGAERVVAKQLEEFLQSIRASTAQRVGRDLGEGHADPASVSAIYTLLETRLGELTNAEIARKARERELREELEVARAKLEALRPKGPVRFRTATIGLDAQRAGRITLDVSYVTRGASWRPAYRARLDVDAGRVALVAEGVVRQSTSEDWDGVALTLSTAAPARGVQPPRLMPWYLRPVQPRAEAELTEEMAVRAPRQRKAKQAFADASGGEVVETTVIPAPAEADSTWRGAAVSRSGYNVSFEVPGRSNVPADGNEHRVRLRDESLDAELTYKAVPALAEAAYLVAKTKAPAAYPLLPGPVRVFAGEAYLGTYPMRETGPGEEVEVPFGQDNRVRVERVRLPQQREKEGFTGRDRKITVAWRTTIENLRGREIPIVIEDRVPKSEDERIVVEIERGTTEGWKEERDRPGILAWTVTLPPNAKREIELVYSVRFPKDLVIPGL